MKAILKTWTPKKPIYTTIGTEPTPVTALLMIDGGQEPILHAVWGFQFYFVGMILFRTSKILDLRKLFLPFLFSLLLILLLQYEFDSSKMPSLVQYVYLITIFSFFTFFQNGLPFLNLIGKNTMGIFLLHSPIVLKSVALILNNFTSNPISSFISICFATSILSLGIALIIQAIPYGPLLFGAPPD